MPSASSQQLKVLRLWTVHWEISAALLRTLPFVVMDWCEKRFASLPWFTPGVISGISTHIKVIPACPIISRQMHFQCKCQQFVRARESEAKQMSLQCYCYGTGIHQSATEYLPGNLAARSSSSRCCTHQKCMETYWKTLMLDLGKWFCLTKYATSAYLFVLLLNNSHTAAQKPGFQHHAEREEHGDERWQADKNITEL